MRIRVAFQLTTRAPLLENFIVIRALCLVFKAGYSRFWKQFHLSAVFDDISDTGGAVGIDQILY